MKSCELIGDDGPGSTDATTTLSLLAPAPHASDPFSPKACQCDNPWGCIDPPLCADTRGLLQEMFAELPTLRRSVCDRVSPRWSEVLGKVRWVG